MSKRCPMCSRVALASLERCECGSPFGQELAVVASPQAAQLTRAWLGIGIGGLILFVVACFTTTHFGGIGAWIAGLAALLVVRGARVVSQAGPHLLAAPLCQALPAARVMPPRPRGDDPSTDGY
jgi:hypothetical protein